MKIRAKINQIRRRFKQIDKSGMLYNRAPELRRKYRKVRMHTLLVSDEGRWMVRRHVFETGKKSGKGRSPAQWGAWFREHHTSIMDDAILPGIQKQTSTFWALHTIIGWEPLNGNIRRSNNPVVGARRNKTKRKRKRNV